MVDNNVMTDKKLNWLLNSRAYRKSKELTGSIIGSPEQMLQLVANAQSRIGSKMGDRLSGVIDATRAAFRLLKAYARGEYREISFESLALIIASIIYFMMPLDVIPDFIVALGFTDDAALLAWTMRVVSADIEKFIAWESVVQETDTE